MHVIYSYHTQKDVITGAVGIPYMSDLPHNACAQFLRGAWQLIQNLGQLLDLLYQWAAPLIDCIDWLVSRPTITYETCWKKWWGAQQIGHIR